MTVAAFLTLALLNLIFCVSILAFVHATATESNIEKYAAKSGVTVDEYRKGLRLDDGHKLVWGSLIHWAILFVLALCTGVVVL